MVQYVEGFIVCLRVQGAALTVEDLLDLSEFSKLVTQRPEGQAIAHQARPLLYPTCV